MKGKIVTLTGPPGIGKGYVKPHIISYLNATDIPVYTTRRPRNGQQDPSRIFLPEEDFQRMLDENQFYFVNELFGHRYAFDVTHLREAETRGGYSVAEIHIDNVPGFREIFPDINMIALVTGSRDLLRQRLAKRGESPESLELRIRVADDEIRRIIESRDMFDFMYVVNPGDESSTVGDIMKYMEGYYALPCRTSRSDLLG